MRNVSNDKKVIAQIILWILIFAGGIIVSLKSTGWLLSYLVFILYYCLILGTMKSSKMLDILKKISLKDKIVSVIAAAFLVVVVLVVISQEKFVYFWDYSSYMYYTINNSNSFSASNFFDVLKSLYYSINHDEYNYLICYIISLPFKLLGQKYLAFELLTCIMFLIPGIYIISLLIYELCVKYFGNASYSLIFVVVALFPSFLYVVLLGYVDAVGLPLMGLSFYLALKLETEFNWKYCFQMSFNLVLLMMLRRWYAAFILSFVLFLIVKEVFFLIYADREKRRENLTLFLKNYTLIGSISLLIFISLLNGMFRILLFNNYSASYAGWNRLSMSAKWGQWFRYFGIVFLAFGILAVVTEFFDRKKRSCNFWCVSTIPGMIMSAVYFWHLADMPEHVYYIFCIQICFSFIIGIIWIINWLKKEKTISMIYAIIVIYVIVNFMVMLCVIPISNKSIHLFTGNRYESRIRSDIDDLNRLQTYLGEITQTTENDKVYVAASDAILNDDILRRLGAPDYSLSYTLLSTTHADLVGGFNTEFFDASIVVVTDPIEMHLTQGSQQVLEYIVNQVQDKASTLGNKYELRKEFELDNGIVAKVYQRTKAYTRDDILAVQTYFDNKYPDNPEIFSERFDAYLNYTFPRQVGMTKEIYPEDRILCSNYYGQDGSIVSTAADCLIYGPYEAIIPGKYNVTFEYNYTGAMKAEEQIGFVDVSIPYLDTDEYHYMAIAVYAGRTEVTIPDWVVDEEYQQAEIRFYAYTPDIEIKKVVISHK